MLIVQKLSGFDHLILSWANLYTARVDNHSVPESPQIQIHKTHMIDKNM